MRVLIVVPWDQEYGGVATVVGNLGRQLQRNGHDVLFLHPGENDKLRTKVTKWHFPGYELNLRGLLNSEAPIKSVIAFAYHFFSTMYQLKSLLCRHNIDIVNIHYPGEYCIYFTFLRKLLPFKLVISAHGADLFPDGKPMVKYSRSFRMLMHAADLVITPSRSTTEEALTVFPNLRPKCTFIHNAVNMKEFQHNYSSPPGEEEYILCIAGHNFKKAIDVLLKAFAELSPLYRGLNLWLVGEGPLTADLKQLADNLQLNGKVKFLGPRNQEDISECLHWCKLFVLPSRAEPFGIVILEALASKKTVVATRVGGIPEIIRSGVSGILVEPDDPRALREAIKDVLGDTASADRMASEGYEIVKQHFQWEIAGAKYQSAFNALMSGVPISWTNDGSGQDAPFYERGQ